MLIDTGMLSSYYHGGKPSALEIDGDKKSQPCIWTRQVVLLEGKSAQSRMKKTSDLVSYHQALFFWFLNACDMVSS